jgi:hypothetical protein
LQGKTAAAIARSLSIDPSYVRRVIRYWNENGTLERWRLLGPLVLGDEERNRIGAFVARPELAFPVRLQPAASLYIGLMIGNFWSVGAPLGLRAACSSLGDAAYQRVHHLMQAARWDCSVCIESLAWLAHRELGATHYGVRQIYIPPQRGWGAVLELLASAKGRSYQAAFFTTPEWHRVSQEEWGAEHERIRAGLADRLPASLKLRLTDLGWLYGGWEETGALNGARWCVEHHGDHEPWTNFWLSAEARLLPRKAGEEWWERHLTLLSLTQVFMLYERRTRTPLWRRFRARLVYGKGFGESPADSFDGETPYYWEDGRLEGEELD